MVTLYQLRKREMSVLLDDCINQSLILRIHKD
jgi:hypothetical protein